MDPLDDKLYVGLTLKDFLRHFVPQVDEQQKEIQEINELKSKPFYDEAFPETMPKTDPATLTRQQRKILKKKAKKENKRKKY
jgi:hypothetical protein